MEWSHLGSADHSHRNYDTPAASNTAQWRPLFSSSDANIFDSSTSSVSFGSQSAVASTPAPTVKSAENCVVEKVSIESQNTTDGVSGQDDKDIIIKFKQMLRNRMQSKGEICLYISTC